MIICNVTTLLQSENEEKTSLFKTENCPIEFVYLFPPDIENDNWRWVAGLIRNHNEEKYLHNHQMNGAFKVAAHIASKWHKLLTAIAP